MSSFKRFNSLERLVINKVLSKIESENVDDIRANEKHLEYVYPKSLVTAKLRKHNTLNELDTETLVYLITNNKSNLELRVFSIFVLFHKLNTNEPYPFMETISKEEYVKEAVIPEIKKVLGMLKLQIELGDNNEADKGIGRDTSEVTLDKTEEQKEEYPRSDRVIDGESKVNTMPPKPNIF